ncbi:hypothetical protein MTY66_22150 [Mycolicibacterium sp. TY66]|uniref:helix-turn-helix transcriptional regulator n=1 Tax=Mycobacteriaceae TaxID=1762 RepID=UPI001BB7194C|nr:MULTISPECIES: helix-turn-helix transcriptional regulator [unclassified Mycolicibacterium]BCI80590.1 hypothetical protein MTY66_22150 [Mycolicibacterium sp. TY66]BCJ81748.1 hypothetical protein MTY81_31210 [Mycolicibacterium sp. TY81]
MDTGIFESEDLGATEEFLGRRYAKMRLQTDDDDQTLLRHERQRAGTVSIDELHFTYSVGYAVNPLERVCICRMHSGVLEQDIIGEPSDAFTAGDVTLLAPPELPYTGRLSHAHYDLTMFDPALLNRVANTGPGRRSQPVRLLGHRPVSAAAGRQLGALIGYLRDHVLPSPEARTSELVAATAAQHLAASVLAALPNTATTEPTPVDRRDSNEPLLRRAIAFIDENAHRDIALSDIAEAIYVTPRAVQYMFRRHLDTTPMQYLRTARLHRAHSELLAGDVATTTVSAVALRWGFAHTGRFAVTYRQTFGCSPHQTLRS